MDVEVQTESANGDREEEKTEAKTPKKPFLTSEGFPWQKFPSASEAEKQFKKAVLKAATELAHDFQTTYLNKVVKGDFGQEILDLSCPATFYETLKSGFLIYLNGHGRDSALRETLREAVVGLLLEKSLTNHCTGFSTRQQYQSFLHESYSYMLQLLNEALHSIAFDEFSGHFDGEPSDPRQASRKARQLRKMLLFAQEALAQGDQENALRLYTERITRSSDSDECWVDLALMWFSMGDEHLAEIVLQEALKKNPMNLVGLLVAGLIAGKQGDERGISYLQALLKQRPLCPEVHVLIAAVHSYLGNSTAAEGFYESARKIHKTLTVPKTPESVKAEDVAEEEEGKGRLSQGSAGSGKGKRNSDGKRGKRSGSAGSGKNKDKRESTGSGKDKEKRESTGSGKDKEKRESTGSGKGKGKRNSDGKGGKRSGSTESGKDKEKRQSTSSDKPKKISATGEDALSERAKRKLSRRSIRAEKRGPSVGGGDSAEQRNNQNGVKTPKGSGSEVEDALDMASLKSLDAELKITKANIGDTKPPRLNKCIFVTWNVTKKHLDIDQLNPPQFVLPEHGLCQGDLTDQDIQYQFNMALEADAEKAKGTLGSASTDTLSHRDTYHRHRLHPQLHRHRHHRKWKSKVAGSDPHKYSIFEGDYYKNLDYHDHDHVEGLRVMDEYAGEDGEYTMQRHSSVPNLPSLIEPAEPSVYSQRFGSELLWSAHLLLKLRQYEFLDLILAREISTRPERSLEYLYIRALSLQLRKREAEALEVIDEALQQSPRNASFWILKGHAHYNLQDPESALTCYERAMMLPHGKESLHLAYLRFGAICIDKGDAQLAKRVTLKGVTTTPSPNLWISIGNASFQLGELDDALHAFSEANKLDNTNPVIWGYLSLVSLAQGNRNLAEQSYSWAIRFGLKKGDLMNEIHELHKSLGYGNAAFPNVPQCIPHEEFLERLGKDTQCAETLNYLHVKKQRNKFDNTESEQELIRKLRKKDADRLVVEIEKDPNAEACEPENEVPKDDVEPKRLSSASNLAKFSTLSIRSSKASTARRKGKGAKSRNKTAPRGGTEKRRNKNRV